MLLVKSQVERKNMLLDTRERVIFVTKWKRTWLNYVLLLGGKWNL